MKFDPLNLLGFSLCPAMTEVNLDITFDVARVETVLFVAITLFTPLLVLSLDMFFKFNTKKSETIK